MKGQMAKRTEESFGRKDSSGKYKNIFKEGTDVKLWKCTEDFHSLDIIPFLAGKNHPQEKPGTATYLVDLWVHQRVGPNEDSYVCPARNYSERCPICEYANTLRSQGASDEEIRAISPKRRVVYNVVCYDTAKEEQKGVQIWEASHFLTEKNFLAISRSPRGGGFIPFADPDDGKTVSFTREGSGINTKYLGFQFSDRDYVISDETLDEARVLDDLIHVPSYEELKEVFFQGDEEAAEGLDDEYDGTGDDVPTFSEDVVDDTDAEQRDDDDVRDEGLEDDSYLDEEGEDPEGEDPEGEDPEQEEEPAPEPEKAKAPAKKAAPTKRRTLRPPARKRA
jgi:hypothetical protein